MLLVVIDKNGCTGRSMPHWIAESPSSWEMWEDPFAPTSKFWNVWNKATESWDPTEGVILVDRFNQWLGSVQNRCSVLQFSALDFHPLENPLICSSLKKLWKMKRFTQYNNYEGLDRDEIFKLRMNDSYNLQPLPLWVQNEEDFIRHLEKESLYPGAPLLLPLDPPVGWKFEQWNKNSVGYAEILERILPHTDLPTKAIDLWTHVLPTAQEAARRFKQKKLLTKEVSTVVNPLTHKTKKL